jgi:hypothetical protein
MTHCIETGLLEYFLLKYADKNFEASSNEGPPVYSGKAVEKGT